MFHAVTIRCHNRITESKEQVNKVAVKLAELYDHQTTVQDLLDDEEDNASIETRALSVINNKIIHQTCTWVRLNACFCIKTTTHSFVHFFTAANRVD